MIEFYPEFLNQLKEQLEKEIPSPSDFALKEESFAYDFLENLRREGGSFLELSATNLNYSYQLARLSTEEEFRQLEIVFQNRMTAALFEIGWIYCQINPESTRAVQLFTYSCNWMKNTNPDSYHKTLIGRTGLPWEDIYQHSIDIMRVEKLSIENFCLKFNILRDTRFFHQIQLTYLSRCEKEELLENEALLAELIATSDIDFLRPAIKNFTAKIKHEEISQLINDAISYRLSAESDIETLGLSPNMLQRIRKQRFNSVLEECVNRYSKKLPFYQMIAGMIKTVIPLNKGFFAIDFGIYIVLDNTEWEEEAYAYLPQIYKPLVESWREKEYADEYWPAINPSEIAVAKDIILGIKKSGVIKLGFSDFEALYTRDLLTITRY